MRSRIIRDRGETVTIIRLSDDKSEETIVAGDILCLISPVQGQYEHWQAVFEVANIDIRKGDILRRDNGLEMQVLRVNTSKLSRSGERTRLDLKDYDRQEPPLEKNEVDASRSDFLPEHKFHPAISSKVWSFFCTGLTILLFLRRSNKLRSPSAKQVAMQKPISELN